MYAVTLEDYGNHNYQNIDSWVLFWRAEDYWYYVFWEQTFVNVREIPDIPSVLEELEGTYYNTYTHVPIWQKKNIIIRTSMLKITELSPF